MLIRTPPRCATSSWRRARSIAPSASQTAFVVAGNVDTGSTPQIIAAAITNRVMSEAAGCVSATATDATVHADFGGGCALATASMHVAGTVDVVVAPDMTTGGVTITLVFAATVDGAPLQGTLVVSTTNGNSFTYASDDGLSLDGMTATAPLLTAGIAAGGATLDAAHATANGTAARPRADARALRRLLPRRRRRHARRARRHLRLRHAADRRRHALDRRRRDAAQAHRLPDQ